MGKDSLLLILNNISLYCVNDVCHVFEVGEEKAKFTLPCYYSVLKTRCSSVVSVVLAGSLYCVPL